MLRLVGGPSINTLPLTPFERSYPMSMASPSSPWAIVWRSYACYDTCV